MNTFNRRDFVKSAGALSLLGTSAITGCASVGGTARPKVVVVGGGYGGATAAKYIAMWSEGKIDVTLVERGDTVRCLLRPTSKTDRIADLPFERATGDVCDAASVRAGMDGCDGVIHLASLSNWNDIHSPRMPAVVVGGTKNVLEAASVVGRPRTVL